VQAKQENEFSCPNCFLLVNTGAVHDGECPHCGGPV
jgi:Zn finger protein HypA/HybF involved in hydrogenase expression